MGYDYINITEMKDVELEQLKANVEKILQLRRVRKVMITHTKDFKYDIFAENEEHGVTF